MRDLYTALLLSLSVIGASAQSTIGSAILSRVDEVRMMGVFPSLALAADPGTGMAQTWNFTAIPEPDGRSLRPWTAHAEEPLPCDTVLFAFGERHTERTFAERPEPPYERISSTTRTWSYDGSGDIDLSWATYKDLVRIRVVTIDSNLTTNGQTTTTRYLWLMTATGEPVLELSRRDGGLAPHAPGVYDVAAIYEEDGIMAASGVSARPVGTAVVPSPVSGLMADQVGASFAGAVPGER